MALMAPVAASHEGGEKVNDYMKNQLAAPTSLHIISNYQNLCIALYTGLKAFLLSSSWDRLNKIQWDYRIHRISAFENNNTSDCLIIKRST